MAVLALICGLYINPAGAEDAAAVYQERYALVGTLLRASMICAKTKAEAKWFLAGLDAISHPDLRAFSKAFPKRSTDWMASGGQSFNNKVMSEGISVACEFARSERNRAISLAGTAPSIAANKTNSQGSDEINTRIIYTGTCKAKFLNCDDFMPCDANVTYTVYQRGRSSFEFTAENENVIFRFEGGRDKQPNLENYTLFIDTVKFGKIDNGRIDGNEAKAEGDCRMRMNKDASEFYSVKCDVLQRESGVVFNFYLTEITKFEKHRS